MIMRRRRSWSDEQAWTTHEMLQWIGLHVVAVAAAAQWDVWRWRWSYDKYCGGSASHFLWLMCDLCGKIQFDDDAFSGAYN